MTKRRKRVAALVAAGLALALVAALASLYGIARREGRKHGCAVNLKQMGLCLRMYAHDNEGRFPADLADLSPEYADEPWLLVCHTRHPELDPPPAHFGDVCDFFYVPGLNARMPEDTVIMGDHPGNHRDGRHVLYVDGRVVWEAAD